MFGFELVIRSASNARVNHVLPQMEDVVSKFLMMKEEQVCVSSSPWLLIDLHEGGSGGGGCEPHFSCMVPHDLSYRVWYLLYSLVSDEGSDGGG